MIEVITIEFAPTSTCQSGKFSALFNLMKFCKSTLLFVASQQSPFAGEKKMLSLANLLQSSRRSQTPNISLLLSNDMKICDASHGISSKELCTIFFLIYKDAIKMLRFSLTRHRRWSGNGIEQSIRVTSMVDVIPVVQ